MFKRVIRRPARVVVQVDGIIYAYNKMEAGSRYEIHFEIGGFDNLQVRPLNLPQQGESTQRKTWRTALLQIHAQGRLELEISIPTGRAVAIDINTASSSVLVYQISRQYVAEMINQDKGILPSIPQRARVSVVIDAHPTKLNGVNGVRGVWSNVDHTIRVRRDKYGTRVDRSRYRDNRPRVRRITRERIQPYLGRHDASHP